MPSHALRLPRRLGRYEVLGHLASGGMAEILLARQKGTHPFRSGPTFERAVAIKRILPHLTPQPDVVRMFVEEARILADIRHPNVVQVIDWGHEDGELFFVMEYLEGENLGGVLRRMWSKQERIDPALGAHVIAEACAGLHEAHERLDPSGRPLGLVHRDVSPQNVFITYSGTVKMLDFGIAKAADRVTRGHLKGKRSYMSPEQCLAKPLDRRSDVFALGIVLYELTTGHRVFKRDGELSTLKAIAEEPIVLPSRVCPGYPSLLESICVRALAKRPQERYQTAADMRRELVAAAVHLGTGELHEATLSQLMQRIFSDRILEKKQMLVHAREDSGLRQLPVADSDLEVEVPRVDDVSNLTQTELSSRPSQKQPWSRLVAGVALGIMITAGSASLFSLRGPRDVVVGRLTKAYPTTQTASAFAFAHSESATTAATHKEEPPVLDPPAPQAARTRPSIATTYRPKPQSSVPASAPLSATGAASQKPYHRFE